MVFYIECCWKCLCKWCFGCICSVDRIKVLWGLDFFLAESLEGDFIVIC